MEHTAEKARQGAAGGGSPLPRAAAGSSGVDAAGWPTNAKVLLGAVCRVRRLTISEWARLHRVPLDQLMACVGNDAFARRRVSKPLAERIEIALINEACAAGLLAGDEPETRRALR